MKISENTSVSMPIRNMLAIVSAVAIGVWAYFGVIERLNKLETADHLFSADLLKKAEQEPKNLEMFMLIEHLSTQIESIEKEIEASRYNKVNIDHLKEQMLAMQKIIDKLRNGTH
nr:Fibrinogen-like coiled coil protein [uncultured Mediterranean phage uvMED]